MTSLRKTVVHSLSWNFVGRIGAQIFQLGFSIALTRLLAPKEFGAIGMLLVFTGFAQILCDSGLSSALIYNQTITEAHRSTAFWLQGAVSLLLTVAFFLSAPAIAHFYELPVLVPLTRLMSVIFIVQALGQTHYALMRREFSFRRLAIANLVPTLISGGVAIYMARHGFGVWSLAWQILIANTLTSLLYWSMSSWRPRFHFDYHSAAGMSRYAIYLLGFSSVNYWTRNGDNLAIGKFLGAHALGIYARTYSLMLVPINNISAVLGQVMFPSLSRVQDDIPRFRRHYLIANRLIALVTFPLMAGLAILAGPFVTVVFGPKWIEVIPLLRVLSFVGLAQSIIHPVGWAYNALGKTRTQFHQSVFMAVCFVIALVISIPHGLMWVVYAYAVWAVLAGALNMHLAGQYMEVSLLGLLRNVGKISGMTFIMGLAVFGFDRFLKQAWPDDRRLIVGTILGAVVYLALCLLTRDETFAEFMDFTGLKKKKETSMQAGPDPVE
jgi:PST family polysaccharide transporter